MPDGQQALDYLRNGTGYRGALRPGLRSAGVRPDDPVRALMFANVAVAERPQR